MCLAQLGLTGYTCDNYKVPVVVKENVILLLHHPLGRYRRCSRTIRDVSKLTLLSERSDGAREKKREMFSYMPNPNE